MRISDWSSDVCSSDLICLSALLGIVGIFYWMGVEIVQQAAQLRETIVEQGQRVIAWLEANGIMPTGAQPGNLGRSEESRGGKKCGSTCRSRWATEYYNNI